MATVNTAYLSQEVEMVVKFIDEPADGAFSRDVEITSIKVFGVEVPVDKKTLDAIKAELLETA